MGSRWQAAHTREPIYVSPWGETIREVRSVGHVSTPDNVNRGYPLTGWIAPPLLSWKASWAGCIYKKKKKRANQQSDDIRGCLWVGVSSLFSITALSLLVPLHAFGRHLQLEVPYLSGCCGIRWRALWTFMQHTSVRRPPFIPTLAENVRFQPVWGWKAAFILDRHDTDDKLWGAKYNPRFHWWRQNI